MLERTTQQVPIEEANSYLSFANELADIASNITLSYFRQSPQTDNKAIQHDAYDPVTIADKAAEEAIITKIKMVYPDHGIVAEESGTENSASDYQWIIDPIDGTGSYICGIPLWGTLIGLTKNNRPILGLMDQPFLGDRYTGTGTRSEYLNKSGKKEITTSPCTHLSRARLATTSPYLFSEEEKHKFDIVRNSSQISRYGTDCSAYALLASGQIDIVMEAGLNAYDICALIPIIEGAGGCISTWDKRSPCQGGQIIASATPELHEEVLQLIS